MIRKTTIEYQGNLGEYFYRESAGSGCAPKLGLDWSQKFFEFYWSIWIVIARQEN